MSDPMQTQRFEELPNQPTPGPERSGNRNLLPILIGVGIALVVLAGAGAAGALFFLNQRSNAIPQFLPAETQFYAALNPNLSDVPNLQRLQAAFPELLDQQNAESPTQVLEEQLGVSFEEDIAPWIGTEIAIAGTGFDLSSIDPEASSEQMAQLAQDGELLIILASRDDAKAQAFLDKQRTAREGNGETFSESKAGNLTIYEQQDAENSPLAAFVYYNKHVFFASRAAALTEVVERDLAGNTTLQANPRFQAVQKGLPETRLGYIFVDGLTLGTLAELGVQQASAQLPPEQLQRFEEQIQNIKALQGLGLSFVAIGDGLQFDSLVSFDLSKLTAEATAQVEEARQPVDAKRVETISRDAVSLFTFKIPTSFKDQVLEAIQNLPDGQQTLEDFESQFEVNLEQDVLSWFNGDASLVILPGDKIGDTTLPATGYFSIRPADRAAAEAGMEKVAAALERSAGDSLSFSQEQIAGADWQAVIEPNTNDLVGGYAFVGDDLVLAFGARAMDDAVDGAGTPISAEAGYKQSTSVLANPNGGLFYLDVQKIIGLVDAAELGDTIDDQTRQRLAPIKAIAAAGEPGVSAEGLARARMIVTIGE